MNVTYHIVLLYCKASLKLKTNASEFWQVGNTVYKPSTLITEVTNWLERNYSLQH
jgi:hypothetical protein